MPGTPHSEVNDELVDDYDSYSAVGGAAGVAGATTFAARELEALHAKFEAVCAELADVKHDAARQGEQMAVLKDTIREQEREIGRLGTLGAGLASAGPVGAASASPASAASAPVEPRTPAGGAGTPGGVRPLPAPPAANAAAVNLQYLKNALVAYMAAGTAEEKRRMLPAITLLLHLSGDEVKRITGALEADAGGGGGVATALFSLFGAASPSPAPASSARRHG
jgi:hypothetical protein